MKITTVLPVSRIKYLDRVLDSLSSQTIKPNNLLVIFDGSESDFLYVRNRITELEFDTRVVQSENVRMADDIFDRRRNIANIHNQFKEVIGETDWIFSIEDDGILPPDALERLIDTVENVENVGLVTGVELGRWGLPYVGAWIADDVNDMKTIETVANNYGLELIQPIDASGLYCALIRASYYKKHTFFANNGLGPDVNLGIYLKQQGFDNYIDWSIPVTHLGVLEGEEVEIKPTDKSRVVKLTHLYGSTWSSGH